ncbi:MAG: glutamate--tRNA ligase [Candidatus Hadarchaeia archaeon]
MGKKNMDDLIWKWTLANAIEHEGSAEVGAVIGKVMAEKPELKSEVQVIKSKIEEIVSEVNDMSTEKQKIKLEEIGAPEREKKKEEGLKELPESERYSTVVTRFAPNPNGPLHLGHTRPSILSHEYARRNDGKFILRFEDTNPSNAKKEMYEMIREDLKWLGLDWDEEYIQSDRMGIYYEYAEKLLEKTHAYICTCSSKRFKELRDEETACPCRNLSSKENISRWESMKKGEYDEGEAVVRIKTNLENPNPALRDWPALRIVKDKHPRTGSDYYVWPLYNFSVAIDDHELGITHVLRGKEHEVNEQRQRQLFDHLNWKYPTALQIGRLSVSGTVLSKTQIMWGMSEGKYEGYDDVRLGTLSALRRRGIMPEALREIVLDAGLTKSNSTLSLDTLHKKNRRIIDEKANRYFFVPEPQKILIRDAPEEKEVDLRLHPNDAERGNRTLPLEQTDGKLKAWIAKNDVKDMEKGSLIRLKDLFNFRITSIKPLEAEFEGYELLDTPKIQWVSGNPIETNIIMPDAQERKGYAEPEAEKLKEGEIIQFERFGFVRIDGKEPELTAVYTHS